MPASPRRSVTRADVARLAGVSTAVVSYVLNNSPKPVADATRQRVLTAIDTLGYQPNASARALSRGRSDMIGLIVPDQRNPYFAEVVVEIDRAARARGMTVLTLSTQDDEDDISEQITRLTQQSLEGIIAAAPLRPKELGIVERSDVRLIFMNQFATLPGRATLGTDYVAGAGLATRHLLELGHRRIAFVGSNSPLDPREAGWQVALADAGIPRGPVFHSSYSLQGGYDAGLRLAAARDGVTAVFAASDQIATGLLAAFHHSGIRVPEDISVIGFDGTPEAAFTWPALSSVSQNIVDMARDAVGLILDGDVGEPAQRLYPSELILRASTAAPSAHPFS